MTTDIGKTILELEGKILQNALTVRDWLKKVNELIWVKATPSAKHPKGFSPDAQHFTRAIFDKIDQLLKDPTLYRIVALRNGGPAGDGDGISIFMDRKSDTFPVTHLLSFTQNQAVGFTHGGNTLVNAKYLQKIIEASNVPSCGKKGIDVQQHDPYCYAYNAAGAAVPAASPATKPTSSPSSFTTQTNLPAVKIPLPKKP